MKETKLVEFNSGIRFEAIFVDGKLDTVNVIAPSRRLPVTASEVEELHKWLGSLVSPTITTSVLAPTVKPATSAESQSLEGRSAQRSGDQFLGDVQVVDMSGKLPPGGIKVKVG